MSRRVEESRRELRSEVERLASDRDAARREILLAKEGRRQAESDAATLMRKVIALTERDRRRFRDLSDWSRRLTRERNLLERERRRLDSEVTRLREEKGRLRSELEDAQAMALNAFLGSAIEAASGEVRVRGSRDRDPRILSLTPGRNGRTARTGS